MYWHFFLPSCCFCCCKLTTLQLGVINDAPQRCGRPEVRLSQAAHSVGKGRRDLLPRADKTLSLLRIAVDVDIMRVSSDARVGRAKCRTTSSPAIHFFLYFFLFFFFPSSMASALHIFPFFVSQMLNLHQDSCCWSPMSPEGQMTLREGISIVNKILKRRGREKKRGQNGK